jgi:hypothetical protein
MQGFNAASEYRGIGGQGFHADGINMQRPDKIECTACRNDLYSLIIKDPDNIFQAIFMIYRY